MSNTIKLDKAWVEALKDSNRFSLPWYREHIITKELLASDVLHGTVADLGCGIGARAYLASQQGGVDNIIGVDGSLFAVRYAKQTYSTPKTTFFHADLIGWLEALKPYTLDNAYMLAVIEHIEDTDSLLAGISKALTKDGRLFISVTENDYHSDPSHCHVFSVDSLLKVLTGYFNTTNIYVKQHIIFATVKNERNYYNPNTGL